jgi:hypothetical protein
MSCTLLVDHAIVETREHNNYIKSKHRSRVDGSCEAAPLKRYIKYTCGEQKPRYVECAQAARRSERLRTRPDPSSTEVKCYFSYM